MVGCREGGRLREAQEHADFVVRSGAAGAGAAAGTFLSPAPCARARFPGATVGMAWVGLGPPSSTGIGFKRLTSMERPVTCATSCGCTTLSGDSPVRWIGQRLAPLGPSLSNQNKAICVSSAPLPGMGSPMMTSKALRRSLATMRMRSSPTA